MPNQHKTALLAWHSRDPTLKLWVQTHAQRRGMTVRQLLDEALQEYRIKQEGTPSLTGFRQEES